MITIIAAIAITLGVLYLGLSTWGIVRLTRKVSNLEVLRNEMDEIFNGVYRQFDDLDRNHGENIKEFRNELEKKFNSYPFKSIFVATDEARYIDLLTKRFDLNSAATLMRGQYLYLEGFISPNTNLLQ